MKPWPKVRLGDVLTHYQEYIEAPEPRMYPKLSVKLYGKGVTLDAPADGMTLKMKRHQLAKAGQVILSEIWRKKGAIGSVPPEGEGALCTSHFFLFDVREDKLDRRWLQAPSRENCDMAKAEASVEELVGMIERGELRLPEMQRAPMRHGATLSRYRVIDIRPEDRGGHNASSSCRTRPAQGRSTAR